MIDLDISIHAYNTVSKGVTSRPTSEAKTTFPIDDDDDDGDSAHGEFI